MELNLANIHEALGRVRPGGMLVDLGCDDGTRTLGFAAAARAGRMVGVESVPERAELARRQGVEAVVGDLNDAIPLDDGSADTVVSNQVIEHLADTDQFVSELARILRPGGVAVVSTENLASWHNVFALLMGWQPFSLTNVSARHGGLGNPLAVHRGQTFAKSWEHLRVFAYRGLRELFELHGLAVEQILGAGYFPLPARLGRINPRHAAFVTVVARKR